MIHITSVIHDTKTNSVEATWVSRTITPCVEVPAVPAVPGVQAFVNGEPVTDKDGNPVWIAAPQAAVPAYTPPDVVLDVPVKCHSYADVQMQMFRDDVAAIGGNIAEHEALIATVEAGIVPYVAPVPTVQACLLKIDADTDAIYGAMLGNRAEEYTLAANEAQAFKAAGYAGTVPGSVQSWATAKGWMAAQSADDILATAAQWLGAQSAIRAQRLLRKEQVRVATDAAGITAAMQAWDGFVAYMRGQLGL